MKTIVTHDGRAHCDELAGISILKMFFDPEETIVLRSMDPSVWAEADFKVDVGSVCNPDKGCFDHHNTDLIQRPFDEIPYASAGLVWKTYGLKVVEKIFASLSDPPWDRIKKMNDEEKVARSLQATVEEVDKKLIRGLDAWDNGFFPKFDRRIPVLTLQQAIHYMAFDDAVNVMARLIYDNIKRALTENFFDAVLEMGLSQLVPEAESVVIDGIMEIRSVGDDGTCLLFNCDSYVVPIATAIRAVRERDSYRRYVVGVVNPVKENTKWGLHIPHGLSDAVDIPQGISFNSSHNRFFCTERKPLLDFATSLSRDSFTSPVSSDSRRRRGFRNKHGVRPKGERR